VPSTQRLASGCSPARLERLLASADRQVGGRREQRAHRAWPYLAGGIACSLARGDDDAAKSGPRAVPAWIDGAACAPCGSKEDVAMMSQSTIALTGFITWSLLLLVLMELIRAQLVLRGRVPANGFTPDNAGLSPFMQRLARAHANCIEGLPVLGGLLLVAIATGRAAITDPLAYVLLGARVFQSTVHLASTSSAAVTIRFGAFALQMAIGVYWAVGLLAAG
jgi:uncharacterized MAPEG superfamily protein